MLNELREAVRGPGTDTRQWFSYGTVDPMTEGDKPITFDEKMGPLVDVKLHPSAAHVRCRVASWCAGNGESEYYPFIDGDEVLVAIPEGEERAGCVIVGRCNNGIDVFPTVVAGNDVTSNKFGFRRLRAPYMIETAQAYGVRNAITGALWMMAADGSLTFRDGFGSYLRVGPDFVGLQATDDTTPTPVQNPAATMLILQLNLQKACVDLQVQGYTQLRLEKSSSFLVTNGTFTVLTAGMPAAVEHVITTEAVLNVLDGVLQGLAGFAAPGALAGLAAKPTRSGVLAAALTAAAPNVLDPMVMSALATAMLSKGPDPTGNTPGVGCPGFFAT